MKTKKYLYAVVPVIVGASLFMTGIASARGMGGFMGMESTLTPAQQAQIASNRFEQEATMLGLSVDVVKNGWAAGKDLKQIAADNGITADQLKQKMQEARVAQMKSHLSALVSAGVITQAQADSRLSFMQQQLTQQKKGRGGHGGMWRGF